MAFRHGNRFRRLFGQAVSAASADRRALIERILPRIEGGKHRLSLRTQAECDAAPRAIFTAWLVDEITGQEAEELLQKVEKVHESPQERYWSHPDDDPLAESIRAWAAPAGEESVLARESMGLRRCGAANTPAPLVNNNENTSAATAGDAAGENPVTANSLR